MIDAAVPILREFATYAVQPLLWYGRQVMELRLPLPMQNPFGAIVSRLATIAAPFLCIAAGYLVFRSFRRSPAPPIVTIKDEEIQGAAQELHRQFEALLKDFDKKMEFEKKLTEFQHKYQIHLDRPNLGKAKEYYEYCEKWFAKLRHMSRDFRFSLWSKPSDEGGVIREDDRGNCLFDAVIDGLKPLHRVPDDITPQALRREVVAWMRSNISDDRLQGFIVKAVQAFIEARSRLNGEELASLFVKESEGIDVADQKKEIEESQKLIGELRSLKDKELWLKYFSLIERDGFYGSYPEFYAISVMRKVCIHIDLEYELGRMHDIEPPFGPEHSEHLYVVWKRGNHFDGSVPRE